MSYSPKTRLEDFPSTVRFSQSALFEIRKCRESANCGMPRSETLCVYVVDSVGRIPYNEINFNHRPCWIVEATAYLQRQLRCGRHKINTRFLVVIPLSHGDVSHWCRYCCVLPNIAVCLLLYVKDPRTGFQLFRPEECHSRYLQLRRRAATIECFKDLVESMFSVFHLTVRTDGCLRQEPNLERWLVVWFELRKSIA